MRHTDLTIEVPQDFDFAVVVDSHGWRALAPFSYEAETGALKRIHRLSDGALLRLTMQAPLRVRVESERALSLSQRAELIADLRTIFSVDWDLAAFYAAMAEHPDGQWIVERRWGRMLVAPSVWEDLAKTLLTTNTTWAQTISMCARLCTLGATFAPGEHAFPTPAEIIALPLEEFAARVRAGYRSASLYALAEAIAKGALNVEAWRSLPSDELFAQVRALRGFGDYAAGTMLRLLGCFDRLAIDSACRSAYRRISGSPSASDAEIRAHYAAYGEWRGLVMWLDIMRED